MLACPDYLTVQFSKLIYICNYVYVILTNSSTNYIWINYHLGSLDNSFKYLYKCMLLMRSAYLGASHDKAKHSSTMTNRQTIAISRYMDEYVVAAKKYWCVLQSVSAWLVALACSLSCSGPAGMACSTYHWLKEEWVGGCSVMERLHVRLLQHLTCFPNLDGRKLA